MATATQATQATATMLGVSANGTVHAAKETKSVKDLGKTVLAQKCGMGLKVAYLQPAPAGATVTCKKCAKLAPAPAAAPAPTVPVEDRGMPYTVAPARSMLSNAVASQAAGASDFSTLVRLETAAGNFVEPPTATRGPKSDKPAEPKEMHEECINCGFHFIRPQVRATCKVDNACAKRQAAKATPADAPAADAPAVDAPAVDAPAKAA